MGKIFFVNLEKKTIEPNSFFNRFGCAGIIILFNLSYWMAEVKIYTVHLIENTVDKMDKFSPDYLFDSVLDISSTLLQLIHRLYLKYVWGIEKSNEILSIKYVLILIFAALSNFLPSPESSQDIMLPLAVLYTIMLTTIIFDHSGFNQFFMEIHPNFYYVSSAIWHLMVLSYYKSEEFLTSAWNTMKLLFLNLYRPNEVKSHIPE